MYCPKCKQVLQAATAAKRANWAGIVSAIMVYAVILLVLALVARNNPHHGELKVAFVGLFAFAPLGTLLVVGLYRPNGPFPSYVCPTCLAQLDREHPKKSRTSQTEKMEVQATTQQCGKCLRPIVPGAKFCANCGAAIGRKRSEIRRQH